MIRAFKTELAKEFRLAFYCMSETVLIIRSHQNVL